IGIGDPLELCRGFIALKRQLAEEGIVNPRNQTVLRELARNGLVVYRPTFRIMNKTFQRFILQATPGKTIAEWEKEGVEISWGTFRTTVLTVVFGVAALLVLTQEQIVAAWIGSIPAVTPVIIKIFGSLKRDSKAEAPAA